MDTNLGSHFIVKETEIMINNMPKLHIGETKEDDNSLLLNKRICIHPYHYMVYDFMTSYLPAHTELIDGGRIILMTCDGNCSPCEQKQVIPAPSTYSKIEL